MMSSSGNVIEVAVVFDPEVVTDCGDAGCEVLQNTWGDPIAGITVADSLLTGDGYTLTLENKGQGTSVGFNNVRIGTSGWGLITATPMSGNGPGAITYTAWIVRTSDGTATINHP
jgi:hypothetical protein